MLKAVAATISQTADGATTRSQSPSALRRRKLAAQRRKVPENFQEMARRRFLGREWKTLGELEKAQLRARRAKEGIKCDVCGAVGYYKETCANDCAAIDAKREAEARKLDSDSDEDRRRTTKKAISGVDNKDSSGQRPHTLHKTSRSPSRTKPIINSQDSSLPAHHSSSLTRLRSESPSKTGMQPSNAPSSKIEDSLTSDAIEPPSMAIVWTDPIAQAVVPANNSNDASLGNLRQRMHQEQIFLRESDKPIQHYQFFVKSEDGYNRNLAELTLHQVLRFAMRVLLEQSKKREALLKTSLDDDATLFHPSKIVNVETKPFYNEEIGSIPEYKDYLYKVTHPPEKDNKAHMFRVHMMAEDALDEAMRGGDINAMKKLYQPNTDKLLSIHSKDGWKSVLAKNDMLASSSTKRQDRLEKNMKALSSQSWVKSQAADMKRVTDSHLHIIDILKSEIEREHDRERRMLEIPFQEKKALNRMSKKLWKERLAAADRIHHTLKLYEMKIGGSEEADYLMFCLDEWIKTSSRGQSSYRTERHGPRSLSRASGGVSDDGRNLKTRNTAKSVSIAPTTENPENVEKQGLLESLEKYFCGKELQAIAGEGGASAVITETQRSMLEAYDFSSAMEYKRKAKRIDKKLREQARRSREAKESARGTRIFSSLDALTNPGIPFIETVAPSPSSLARPGLSRSGTSGSRGSFDSETSESSSETRTHLPHIRTSTPLKDVELTSSTRRDLAERKLRNKILQTSQIQPGESGRHEDASILIASGLMTSTAATCAEDLLKSFVMDETNASAEYDPGVLLAASDNVDRSSSKVRSPNATASQKKDKVDDRSLAYQRNLDKMKYEEMKTKFEHVGLEKNIRSGNFTDSTSRAPAVIPIHRVITYDPPELQMKSQLANSIMYNQMRNFANKATGFAEPHYATLFSRSTLFETNGTTPGGDVRFEDTSANRSYAYLLGRSMVNLEKHAVIDPHGTLRAKKGTSAREIAKEARKQAAADEKLMMMRGVYGFH